LQGSQWRPPLPERRMGCGDLSIYRHFSLWHPDDSGDKSPHSKFPRGQAARGFCTAATKAVTGETPVPRRLLPMAVSAPLGHRATETPRWSFLCVSVALWL